MGFLRELDYLAVINQDNLNTILKQARGIVGDEEILLTNEAKKIMEAKNSLRARYKTDLVFDPFQVWSLSTSYTYNQRLDWTATDYDSSTVYTSGNLVGYAGYVYEKNSTTSGYVAGTLPSNSTYFTNRGIQRVYYVTPPSQFDEDIVYIASTAKVTYKHKYYIRTSEIQGYAAGVLPTDTRYWTVITDLSPYAVTGHWPNETSYWTQGDNRDLSIVECIVDLVLYDVHAIINPRQVPAKIEARWNKSVEWLANIRKGLFDLDLPEFGPEQGYRMRFGSNPQNQMTY